LDSSIYAVRCHQQMTTRLIYMMPPTAVKLPIKQLLLH